MDMICKNCKYWSEEKLKIWGKERDNYRLCKKGKIKTYTFAGSSCDDDMKAFKKKGISTIDKIFAAILLTLYALGSLILIAGTLKFGF